MRIRLILIMLIQGFYSCDNYNLNIESRYRTPINSYRISDTIYFQSQKNSRELDTIVIKNIDSIRQYPKIGTVPPMKEIYLRIEHLPIDNWKEKKIAGTKEKRKNQPMITSSNVFEECCQLRIKYRDFESTIDEISDQNMNIIDTLKPTHSLKMTVDKITELYWSNKNGIVGYKKYNGQTYLRKTHYNNGYK